MVFGLFSKKKEVVDFRPKESDMPIPAKMREKLIGNSGAVATSPSNLSSNSGGFFGFFGGGASGDSSGAISAPATDSASASSEADSAPATDFWGNPVNNSQSTASSASDNSSSQISDVSYRLSRTLDRLELIEKKIDRLERRTGISSDGN